MVTPSLRNGIINDLPHLLEVAGPNLGGLCYNCFKARRELVARHLSDRDDLGNGKRFLVDADVVVLAVPVVSLLVSPD